MPWLFVVIIITGCGDSGGATAGPKSIANGSTENANQIEPEIPQSSGFDFYVLSLSWSPHYCASKGGGGDAQQCRSAKPFGFIVHGLWPQNERGYPKNCMSNEVLSRNDIRSILDLTPSTGLVRHEWEKHGSCSGLTPPDYLKAMRVAREAVIIPAQFINSRRAFAISAGAIENAFVLANPKLNAQSISVDCDRQKLAEVRICLSQSMQFRTCSEVDRTGCRDQTITVEPVK
jgi:ribonuclease T2